MSDDGKTELRDLVAQVDDLLKHPVHNTSPSFKVWHTKVMRLLSREFGPSSVELKSFEDISFALHVLSRGVTVNHLVMACRDGLRQAKELLSLYLEDDRVSVASGSTERGKPQVNNQIFLVHGHDGELRQTVARLLERQNIEPIVLMEQANMGATIIEKIERNADVSASICLFTGDDLVVNDGDAGNQKRARQNVVFEAGYFIGRIGRERVVIISEGDVEMPSDLAGVIYINKSDWKLDLLKELRAMGFEIDCNRAF